MLYIFTHFISYIICCSFPCSYYSLWDATCQQPVAFNYLNSQHCSNVISNQTSSQITCQGLQSYSAPNCSSGSQSGPTIPLTHFNCTSTSTATVLMISDSSLLASSFCNTFHTSEPSHSPTVEPTMTPTTAAPILPTKMPHSPSFAPIWLTNTGWSSFDFYSTSDCMSSGYVVTESIPSNLCVATSYGSYKYRFQQSKFDYLEILFSNYSDTNCKNVRFYNHIPSLIPIQACIPVSSLVSFLPYLSDMSNMYVNVSMGTQTGVAMKTQSVVNT